jgi:nucleotide-binding universal stress UspA family protein
MKILVGLDESKHADTTLQFVAGMSWPKDVSVIVVSAVQLPLGAYGEAYAPVAVDTGLWMEEVTKLHREVVKRAAETLRGAGLATEARVAPGDPREVLIDEAKAENVDLIVVGSHGRTGIGKLVMGSVATHVVTHAPCSVLVVRARP